MDNMWAPWRMEYIQSDKSGECIFCTAPAAGEDADKKILFRGEHSFVILNIYPYSNGHLMVTPYRHLPCLSQLNDAEVQESGKLIQKSIAILREAYHPDGFNVGYRPRGLGWGNDGLCSEVEGYPKNIRIFHIEQAFIIEIV